MILIIPSTTSNPYTDEAAPFRTSIRLISGSVIGNPLQNMNEFASM